MKLVYLAPVGLFDDWAHTIQIMKMCEAFSENGLDVELVVPKRKNTNNNIDPEVTDPYEYNSVKKIFKITRLPFLDLKYGDPSKFFYWVRFISFLISSRFYLLFSGYDVLYTREHYLIPFFRNVIVEKHSLPKEFKEIHKFVFKKCAGIVVLTSFLKNRLIENDINPEKIFVSHDGVNPSDFEGIIPILDARLKLKLLPEDFIFGYLGTLKTMGMEKGVKTGIDSLKFLPDNFKFYVIGGDPVDVDFYKKYTEEQKLTQRVMFTGRISMKLRSIHNSACDALVAPFPVHDHYSYYMSPLKIFEYMASKRPIVVTDLPSLKEVLVDEVTALFVPPENPESLAGALKRLSDDEVLGKKLTDNAYEEMLQKYTWKKRAENIEDFFTTKQV